MRAFAGLWVLLVLALVGVASATAQEPAARPEDPFVAARNRFADCPDDESLIEPTIRLFARLAREFPERAGRAEAYIGALTAMKAKFTRWPHRKVQLIRRGLHRMDRAIEMSPDDAETLFIHGVTCRFTPFPFRRKDDAKRDFDRILRLIPSQLATLEEDFVVDVVDFIDEHGDPDADARQRILAIRDLLNLTPPPSVQSGR